ncbi:hypothetical protein DL93DRAFT_2192009 [Clavulina sp. PMI_390]|nr:hypothetical protein DL93DRAFT_2192009 [Clavulina sp. PMI_390]
MPGRRIVFKPRDPEMDDETVEKMLESIMIIEEPDRAGPPLNTFATLDIRKPDYARFYSASVTEHNRAAEQPSKVSSSPSNRAIEQSSSWAREWLICSMGTPDV